MASGRRAAGQNKDAKRRGRRRRAAGEGSIYRAPEGAWRAVADLGWYGGRRQRKYVRGSTQAEVLHKLRELQREADAGVVHRDKVTVEQWLRYWLETVVKGRGASERTIEFYEEAIRRHLVKGLGRVPLCKLTPEDVDGCLQEEAAARALGTLGNRVEATLKAPLIAPKHRLLRL